MPQILGDLLIRLSAELGDTQAFLDTLRQVADKSKTAEAANLANAESINQVNAAARSTGSTMGQAATQVAALGAAAQGTAGQANQAAQAINQVKVAGSAAAAGAEQAAAGLKVLDAQAKKTAVELDGIGGAIDALGAKLGKVIEQTLLYGLAFQALAEVETIIKDTAGVFEEAQAKITGATGAIGANLKAYEAGLSQLMDTAVQAAPEIGKAMGDISSAFRIGPGDDLTKLTGTVLNLAKVSGETTDLIVNDAAKIAKAFKLDPNEFESAMDRVVTVSQDAHIKVSELLTTLAKFAGVFNELHVPTEQAIQFLGRLSDEGLNVNSTMVALQQAMQKLGKAGVVDLSDGLKQLFERIHNASTETEAFQISAKVFEEHAAAMNDAIYNGNITFDDFSATLDPLHAKLKDQADAMRALADEWQALENRVAKGEIGKAMTVMARESITALNVVFSGIEQYIQWVTKLESAQDTVSSFTLSLVHNVENIVSPIAAVFNTLKGIWSTIQDIKGAGPTTAALSTEESLRNGQGPSFNLSGGKINLAGTGEEGATAAQIAADRAALDKILLGKSAGDTEYKTLKQQVDALARRVDGKNNVDFLRLEKEILNQILKAPTETDQLNRRAQNLAEQVKLNQRFNRPSPDDLLTQLSGARFQQQRASLDSGSAQRLLGITDTTDVRNQIELVREAFARLAETGNLSGNKLTIALVNLSDKTLAWKRAIGDTVTSFDVLENDFLKTQQSLNGMDFGLARVTLGLTTTDQASQSAQRNWAAYSAIVEASNLENATAIDVTNALIDVLTKNAAAARAVGQAFGDGEQAALDFLNTQKQIDALNQKSALALFGLQSEGDLNNAVKLLTDAYQKIKDAQVSFAIGGGQGAPVITGTAPQISTETIGALALPENINSASTAVQGLVAQYKILQEQINDLGKTGGVVTAAMIQQSENLRGSISALTTTLASSLQNLSVLTVNAANQSIETIKRELDQVGAAYTSKSSEYQQAALKAYTDISALLVKSGQAVPKQLTADIDALKATLTAASITIDQAYQQLGVTGSEAAVARMKVLQASLEKIQQDSNASAFTVYQAQVAYSSAYYQTRIQLGEDFDKKDKAFNDLQKERVRLQLEDSANQWRNFTKLVGELYNTVSADLASGITGLINGTTTVSQAFLKMGQDIEAVLVKYVIQNLLLTKENLNSLQQGLLSLFGAGGAMRGAGTSALASTGNVAGAGGSIVNGSGAFGFLTGAGQAGSDAFAGAQAGVGAAGSGAASAVGMLGSLANIANIANLGVSVASGIVAGFQAAHANDFLEKIELSTRYLWVATGEADDSISRTNKTIAQKVASLLDFMNVDLRAYLQNINIDLDAMAGKAAAPINLNAVFDLSPVTDRLSAIGNLMVSLVNYENEAVQILKSLASGSHIEGGGPGTSSVSSVSGVGRPFESAALSTVTLTPGAPGGGGTPTPLDTNLQGPSFDQLMAQQGYITPTQQRNNTWIQSQTPNLNGPNVQGNGTLIAQEGYDIFGASIASSLANPQAPNYDALQGQSQSGLLSILSFNAANPHGVDAGFYKAALGGYLQGLNLPNLSTGSGSTNALGIPITGIDANVLNRAFGLQMSNGDFETLIEPVASTILRGILNAYFPAGTDFTNLSSEDLATVQGLFDQQFPPALDLLISNIATTHPELIDRSSPLRGGGTNANTPHIGVGGTRTYTGAATNAGIQYTPNPAGSGLLNAGAFGLSANTTGLQSLASAVGTQPGGAYVPGLTGGAAGAIDPNSYTGRFLAMQAGVSLPASVSSNAGVAIDYNSLQVGGNPNSYSYSNALNPTRPQVFNIAINGSQMTPQQVTDSLVSELRNRLALIR